MDIHKIKPGAKVKFLHPNNGYPGDRVNLHRLFLGATYTVMRYEIHSWHTEIYLEEHPGLPFNSVFFEDA